MQNVNQNYHKMRFYANNNKYSWKIKIMNYYKI